MNKQERIKTTASKLPLPALKQILALLMVLVFLAGCASSQPDDPYRETDKRKAAKSNTSLGLEYMNRGQYEVAMGKLKKAVREDPTYSPGQTVLAVLYERLGEMEMAGKHYRKAYEVDPKDGDVNNNYCAYLCKTGKEKQAIEHCLKALDDPFYSTPSVALTNAGSCSLGSGDYVAADDYLRRALKIEPDFSDALLNMAKLNFEEGNYLKSRAFMQRYEIAARHVAETLLLAYRIEIASGDRRAANKYKLMLESTYPESDQAAEVRRLSGR